MKRPFDAQARRDVDAYERLGTRKPHCHQCNETNPHALTGTAPNIRCYECQAKEQGRSQVEGHHVAGQHNRKETVDIPGNDHRILSDRQRDWPIKTLRNPSGSPALQAAACIRGWLDALKLTIDRTMGWIPPFLEWLDTALCSYVGEQWWVTLGWEGVR